MRLALIFVLALSIHLLYAQDSINDKSLPLIERIRPTLISIIGEKWTIKMLGAGDADKNAQAIVMPAIPKVIGDATSTAVYNKKGDKIKLKSEVEEKYYAAFVREIFEAAKGQKPNDDELAKMANVLAQGGTREGVYHSIVLDSSYSGMENYDHPIKSNAADFAVYFYEHYLGKKIERNALKGMNIYTVKRLIVDKALDVVDAFGDKREDLENWYALMSADLAAKFPQIWTSKIRKDTEALHHKSWAAQVPVQHIKSETIIKIHLAFNSLM